MSWSPVPTREHNQGIWHLQEFDEVTSTNELAYAVARQALERNQAVHGKAFLAARQSAGKGQHGRIWNSPPGGLYLTALMENLPAATVSLLPLQIGVQVANLLDERYDLEAGIRWPNDVVVDNKKIAGILCEALVAGNRNITMVGIGVNVCQSPDELPDTAVTLAQLNVTGVSIPTLALQILDRLAELLTHPGAVLDQVRRRDVLFGKTLTIETGDELLHGSGGGISDAGHLIVQLGSSVKTILSGSVLVVDGQRIKPQRHTHNHLPRRSLST